MIRQPHGCITYNGKCSPNCSLAYTTQTLKVRVNLSIGANEANKRGNTLYRWVRDGP